MADNLSVDPSFSEKLLNPLSSLFAPQKLFMGFSSKSLLESEASMSPTSILEARPFSGAGSCHRKSYRENGDSRAIGLGIIDSLNRNDYELNSTMMLGSQLKIQIPSIQSRSRSPIGSVESPRTPIEFGVNNRNSKLASLFPANIGLSSPSIFEGYLSSKGMELSEDYTCVISYGPNRKKTHIFENFIVVSSEEEFVGTNENKLLTEPSSVSCLKDFLSFCHACRKKLAVGEDVFMYRGERAFCSQECRQQEIISDSKETESCLEGLLTDF